MTDQGDEPQFNDEALATQQLPVPPAQSDRYAIPSYASPSDVIKPDKPAPVPELKLPEHSFLSTIFGRGMNASEDEQAMAKYQLDLQAHSLNEGIREFEVTQKASQADTLAKLSDLSERRGIQLDNTIERTHASLSDIWAKIQEASHEGSTFAAAFGGNVPPLLAKQKTEYLNGMMENAKALEGFLQSLYQQREKAYNGSEGMAATAIVNGAGGGAQGTAGKRQPVSAGGESGTAPQAEGAAAGPSMAMPDFSTPEAAVQFFSGRMGFPTEAEVSNGEAVFYAQDAEHKKRLDQKLEALRQQGNYIPARIEDRSKILDDGQKTYNENLAQLQRAQTKQSFYKSLELASKDTQKLQMMLSMYPEESEEADAIKQAIGVSENQRVSFIKSIGQPWDDLAEYALQRHKALQLIVDKRDANLARTSGVNLEEKSSISKRAVKSPDTVWLEQYAQAHGFTKNVGDPIESDEQWNEMTQALDAMKKGGGATGNR